MEVNLLATPKKPNPRFEVYRDDLGEWRWRLWSSSDVIADSGQGYSTKAHAERAIAAVKRVAPDAPIVEE